MNANRNLYKIRDSVSKHVRAFLTAADTIEAIREYYLHGGDCADVFAEQISKGWPAIERHVYK